MTVTVWLAMAHFIIGVNRLQKFNDSLTACRASVDTVVYSLTITRPDRDRPTCCTDKFSSDEAVGRCLSGKGFAGRLCDEPEGEELKAFECVAAPSYSVKPLTP